MTKNGKKMCLQQPNQNSGPMVILVLAAMFAGLGTQRVEATVLFFQNGAESNPELQESEQSMPPQATWRFGQNDEANGIYRLQYSPNGKLLAARDRKNVVAIYDVTTRKRLCEVNGHDNNWVVTIDFSPDSEFFMTAAGPQEEVKIWDAQTGKLETSIKANAAAAYFDESGSEIHVLGDTHVKHFSWPGGQMTSQQRWKSGSETRVGMSRDGKVVVTYRTLNRQVYRTQVVDLENKSKIQLDGPTGIPKTVSISANRVWIAAAYHRDPKIRLWDLRDPHQKKYALRQHKESVQSLSFSQDNRFLLSSGWDKSLIGWDLLTRQSLFEFTGHTEHVNSTAFSPTSLVAASGASGQSDTSVITWDLEDIIVKPLVRADQVSEKQFEKVWTSLGSNSLDVSLGATSELLNGGDEYLSLIEKRLGAVLAANTFGSVGESVKLLEHPEWSVREKATIDLLAIRDKADAELRMALKETTSPEIKSRISRILRKKVPPRLVNLVDFRRWSRIVFALEYVNTDRTQEILRQIGNSSMNAETAEDAKAAVKRNERFVVRELK